jgi:hypothetical protein
MEYLLGRQRHFLCSPSSADRLASLMQFVNSNIAKKVGGAGADAAGTGVVKCNAGGNAQSGNSLVISLAWAIRLATPARKSATKAR